MQLKRLGLGIRFDFLDMVPYEEVQRLVFEEIFSILTLSDVSGLDIYGGTVTSSLGGENIYTVVIMGGKLRRMRRIYDRLHQDAAIGMYLCHTQPFLENNRLAEMEAPPYFGQVGKDGYLHGGNSELGIRVSNSRGRRRNVGKGIHILLAPSSLRSISAIDAVKRLTFAARSSFPGVRILPFPLITGEGCAAALATAANGSIRRAEVSATGEKLCYSVLRGKIAVIEAQNDSYATGVAIRRALDEGLKTIYITRVAASDEGMGCARALGVKFFSADGQPIESPEENMTSDVELLHPMAQGARFILMCDSKSDSLGSIVMDMLHVKKQDALEAILDAAGFERLLTGKALVVTGGEDISMEGSLGWRAMRSISRRCIKFKVPVIVMTCNSWDDPDFELRSPQDAVGIVKMPLKADMSAEVAGNLFDETANRVFRFIRLGRDVEKIGAPKKEPRRIRYLPHQIKKRLISDETGSAEFWD